jgi:hypothetical protein
MELSLRTTARPIDRSGLDITSRSCLSKMEGLLVPNGIFSPGGCCRPIKRKCGADQWRSHSSTTATCWFPTTAGRSCGESRTRNSRDYCRRGHCGPVRKVYARIAPEWSAILSWFDHRFRGSGAPRCCATGGRRGLFDGTGSEGPDQEQTARRGARRRERWRHDSMERAEMGGRRSRLFLPCVDLPSGLPPDTSLP